MTTPKPLTIAEIILLVVVIAGGGIWLAKKPSQVTRPNPTPTLSASFNPDEISDKTYWRTFTGPQGSFTVRYPFQFQTRSQQWSFGVNDFSAAYEGTEIFYARNGSDCHAGWDTDPCDISIGFAVIDLPLGKAVEDLRAQAGSQVEATTALGRKGWLYNHGAEGIGILYHYLPLNTKQTLVIAHSYIDDINFASPEYLTYDQQSKLFSEILSTFIFTESSMSFDISTWKTYTSKTLNISFSYPPSPRFTITGVRRGLPTYGYSTSTYPAISLAHTIPLAPQCLGGKNCRDITQNPEIIFIVLDKPYAEVVASSSLSSFKDIFEQRTIGKYSGTYMQTGAEGEGRYYFFFPMGTTKTMYMQSNYVMESNDPQYKTLKDWIPFVQQEPLFHEVIKSLQFTNISGTSTWKTYRNNEYGFEMKHPQSWTIREINSSPTKQIILDSDIQSTMAIHYVATLPEYLNQNGYYRNNGLTLKEYLDEEAQQRNIDDIQAYDLSGTLAYSYEALAHKYLELSTKPAQFGVIAVHNGSVYEILFSHAPTAEEKQILRSFRFTN